ncbi:MAG: DUF928 domain-containing protein [Hormoscilla sp.]
MKKIPKFSIICAAGLLLSGSIITLGRTTAQTFSTPEGVPEIPQRETIGSATRDSNQCLLGSVTRTEAAKSRLQPGTNVELTTEERPTFSMYVPETTATYASFSLQDSDRNQVYQTKVLLPGKGGVLNITLPLAAENLLVGENYRWFLEIHCAPGFDPDNPIASGAIRRI